MMSQKPEGNAITIGIFMNIFKLAVVISAVALISSCATQPWTHPDKSEQDFYADDSQCMSLAGYGTNLQIMPSNNAAAAGWNQGAAIGTASTRNQMYERCMMGKGYARQTTEAVKVSGSMMCRTRSDCPGNQSCRSKPGGGTECRGDGKVECKTSSDCSGGLSCRSKSGGGTECRWLFALLSCSITMSWNWILASISTESLQKYSVSVTRYTSPPENN